MIRNFSFVKWSVSILLFAACIFFQQVKAQSVGSLTGNVKDYETQEPLIGAIIAIEGTNLGATTDLDGNYTIVNIPTKS